MVAKMSSLSRVGFSLLLGLACLTLVLGQVDPDPAGEPENIKNTPDSGDGQPGSPYTFKVYLGQGVAMKAEGAESNPPNYKKVIWDRLGGPQTQFNSGTGKVPPSLRGSQGVPDELLHVIHRK